MTVEPYAIANNLPFNLAASFEVADPNAPELSSNFFFTNLAAGRLSNHTVLLGWSYAQIAPMVNWLISTYFAGSPPVAPDWPSTDYDTIWTVKLDGAGNLTVDNTMCEGIDSTKLPATCPEF
jgi:hypothetical protein